ncbi:hypothetical protein JNB71_22045 [Rhizobium herbae]|uniref:Four helix bundle protein n=1 Tax=Rhizobium herbae TaxID=508661 RepID=A0ABS7HFM9_9HYPH|nr:hypothetical protein [Rhizobium herbae]MBW9065993.1 hypothetical protein [Rhizobium herbae]
MEMKTEPLWYRFLERVHPTSVDGEFASLEFELAFAVNIRAALSLVEATPACRRFADIAIKNAVNYSCLRHSGKRGGVLADAHRAIDEALWRLITELRNCKSKVGIFADLRAVLFDHMTDRGHRHEQHATPRPAKPYLRRP